MVYVLKARVAKRQQCWDYSGRKRDTVVNLDPAVRYGKRRDAAHDLLLDLKDLVEASGFSKAHAARLLKGKGLPFLRFGRKKLVLADDFDAWAAAQRSPDEARGPGRRARPVERLSTMPPAASRGAAQRCAAM